MTDHFHWVAQHGYGGLFVLLMAGIVGLPVPDETLLAFAGFLAYRGDFALWPTVVAGFLGSAAGITVSYLLGRTAGHFVIHKLGPVLQVDEAKIGRVRQWFERLGRWVLMLGYFVPGVRHFTALVAGTSALPYWEFMPFAYGGALIWSVTFIALGYLLGRQWEIVVAVWESHRVMATSVVVVVLLVALVVRRCNFFPRRGSVSVGKRK